MWLSSSASRNPRSGCGFSHRCEGASATRSAAWNDKSIGTGLVRVARVKAVQNTIMIAGITLVLLSSASAQTKANPGVNQDAAIASDFQKRVADYMKIHQQAQSGLTISKKADSPEQIIDYQHQLAAKIRELRPQVKQGDIFTPEITGLFQRLIASSLNGPEGDKIRKSYQHAEPDATRGLRLDVNETYPDHIPLQSMPPSLLLNLPQLPKELEYRFVGHELVLRDIPANLIVDAIADVRIPEQK